MHSTIKDGKHPHLGQKKNLWQTIIKKICYIQNRIRILHIYQTPILKQD